jgi:hypothetical protein
VCDQHAETAEPRYFLSSQAFMCATGYHWVLLDLESDKYLAIHRRDFEPLTQWLHGSAAIRTLAGECSCATFELAGELVRRKLLTTLPQDGKVITGPTIAPSTKALPQAAFGDRIAPHLKHLPSFLVACAKADHWLRRKTIAQIVRGVKQRKELSHSHGVGAAEDLVRAFNVLRPIYPRDYLCLFDSLALIEFMAAHRFFPTWVFGVTSDPFMAHCWVQEGDIVLNDTVEHVAAFAPLMAV